MKKLLSIIGVVALISFSCSNEDAPIDLTNLSQENQAKMIMFLKSNQFKDYISTKNKQSNDQSKIAGKQGNNGIMVLVSPYGFGISSFNPQTGNFKYIGGDAGSIEKLPNDRAKFSVHTNNPSAFDSSENLSSSCVDGPLGTFNFSVICDYTVEVYDFGEWGVFTFYNMTDENSSATSINGHCKISDAQEMIDWDTYESLGCTEATVYKTMRVKGNDLKGFRLSVE
jgi:hypothetical protein